MKALSFLLLLLAINVPVKSQELIDAIKANDFEKTMRLVTPENINLPDENGATPLMWAVYLSDLKMVKALVDKGADFRKKGVIYLNEDKSSYYGNLMGIAAGEGNLDILEYLVEECEIDVDDQEYDPITNYENGWTAMHWAADGGYDNIIEYLIMKGADINFHLNHDGNTPLLCAIQNKRLNTVNFLLNKRVNSDIKNTYGWGALHYVVFNGLWEQVKWLVEKNADINLQNNDGMTALMILIKYNYSKKIYEYLLEKGADISILDKNGVSSIMLLNEYLDSDLYYSEQINFFIRCGKFDSALYYAKEYKNEVIKKYGFESEQSISILNYLGVIYFKIGEYNLAISSLNEAHSIGIRIPELADHKTLSNLALVYSEQGYFDKALSFYNEALSIAELKYGHDDYSCGTILNNIAMVYNDLGRFMEAMKHANEALSNIIHNFGEGSLRYGVQLNNLAGIYKSTGDYNSALTYFHAAKNIIEKSIDENIIEYANVVTNLANLYNALGMNLEALELYEEALTIKRELYGEDHFEYALALNGYAILLLNIGDTMQALRLLERSAEIILNFRSNTSPAYHTVMTNLLSLYLSIGENDKAYNYMTNFNYEEIFPDSLYDSTEHFNKTYDEMLSINADYYRAIGFLEIAKALYELRAKHIEKTLGKEHLKYSTVLNDLAMICSHNNEKEKALNLYQEALSIVTMSLGSNHPDYGVIMNNLALLHYGMGNKDIALSRLRKAIENNFKNINQNFSFFVESEKEKFLKTVSFNFNIYQSFFLNYSNQNTNVSNLSFDIEIATKGIILNSGIQMRQAIANSGDSVAMAKFDEWLAIRHSINHLQNIPISQRYFNVDSLIDAANTLERELTRRSQEFGEMQASFRIKWEDVQEGLAENEAAIEFVSFNYHDGKNWTDSIFYSALVITKDCEFPYMTFLYEEKDLTELLPGQDDSQWDYNLAYQGSRAAGVAYFETDGYKGDKLYELIWQPIDSLLQGIETIYYAPSGLLHNVSMAAIPTPDGDLLLNKYNLVHVSSTRQLAMPDKPTVLNDAVVFGGIDYDMDASKMRHISQQYREKEVFASNYVQLRGMEARYAGFNYLEGSLREAQQVAAMLGKKVETRKITGSEAIEESFKALSGMQSPSIIHIATHGFYFPDTISDRQRDQMMFSMMGEERFRFSDDPLMRSALVMAGANHTWLGNPLPDGVEDGILTAKDVSAMNLTNTQLVVLSACQTGLGDVKGSEGVTGLQRAFKMAGVRYIMMSLWPVPDKETEEFMEAFYQNWLNDTEIREAFRLTQQQMHTKYPNEPYKWAAFVMVE